MPLGFRRAIGTSRRPTLGPATDPADPARDPDRNGPVQAHWPIPCVLVGSPYRVYSGISSGAFPVRHVAFEFAAPGSVASTAPGPEPRA